MTSLAKKIKSDILKQASKKTKAMTLRFFKTKKGDYAEHDQFIGVTTPALRKICLKWLPVFQDSSLTELTPLLQSPIHENRSCAVLLMTALYENSTQKKSKQKLKVHSKLQNQQQKKIVQFYLKHSKYINNWDLVDQSAAKILGHYFFHSKNEKFLYKLANSKFHWHRRMAMVATHYYIKNNKPEIAVKMAHIFLSDSEDLMHKATGWMLREVGKVNKKMLVHFLNTNLKQIPRTTLRYAIEKMPEKQRQAFLTQ